MDILTVNEREFLDLSDEILIIILEKLQPIDILYSLVGVNRRLNSIAGDVISRSGIDLVKISSATPVYTSNKSEFDWLCLHALPQIQHYIKMMVIESSTVECVLHSGDYPNLNVLDLNGLKYAMFSNYFSDDLPIARLLKQQITNLHLSFEGDSSKISTHEFSRVVCSRILAIAENLMTLDFRNFDFWQPSLSFRNLPIDACHSSSLVYLKICVSGFEDCLTLLDGRLSQLSTFHVIIRRIDQSLLLIDHTTVLPKLTIFSMKCYRPTLMYDKQIVSLLCHMSSLEMLTLSLTAKNRKQFIDGNQLDNEILICMPRLNKFIFNIRTVNESTNDIPLESTEDIQRSFTNSRWPQVNCWADHFSNGTSLCNIFSLPLTMNHLDGITNSFPGGLFSSVHYLTMLDVRPFEHEFFNLITQAFPNLQKLRLTNMVPQLRKQHWHSDDDNNNLNSSIVVYPNLRILSMPYVHIDYIEEFLHENNSRLPCLQRIYVKFEQLETVTNNFTNKKTRQNCANLKFIQTDKVIVYPKDSYSYFPLL